MFQEAHDLVFLSIFSVQFWRVSLIFQLTVDQSALVCVSTMRLNEIRHYNHWFKSQVHYVLCFSTSNGSSQFGSLAT